MFNDKAYALRHLNLIDFPVNFSLHYKTLSNAAKYVRSVLVYHVYGVSLLWINIICLRHDLLQGRVSHIHKSLFDRKH